MKRYLLLYNDMRVGGIEKSIISLLNSINYSEIEVDLLLLRAEGKFMSYIPEQVHVMDGRFHYNFSNSCKSFFSDVPSWSWRGKRICYAALSHFSKVGILYKGAEVSYLASLLPRTKKKYDAVISYVDWSFDYAIKYVNAERKYFYIHVDYDKSINLFGKDRRLFPLFSAGFAVSEDSCEKLRKKFLECQDKIFIWPNIIQKKMLWDLAFQGETFTDRFEGARLLTVCRASHEKGLDISIKACAILKRRDIKFRWYYIGNGPVMDDLKKEVIKEKLQDQFIFLGEKANPYGFFKSCDIYIQSSRSEGYGITLAEAAVFAKPRIVSDIEVFKEQIKDGETGLLSQLDEEDLARKIERLIADREYCGHIGAETGKLEYDNSRALKIFYSL